MTPIWRGMDQATIDREYNARATVPDFGAEMVRYREASAAARGAWPHRADLVFDPASGCALDWFAGAAGGPVLVWVHGGYWRALSKADNSCVAPGLVAAGVHVAVVDYSLAPDASLDVMVEQVRLACAWARDAAAGFGADPGRLFVGGSSAGGHLAAMAMAEGWAGLPPGAIRGGVCLSGLYDLEPIRLSHINAWMRLDADQVERLSPLACVPRSLGKRLLVSYGGLETSEFKRQSEQFAASWSAAGHDVLVVPQAARNHFDLVLGLGDGGDALCQAACSFLLDRTDPCPR